MRMASFVVPVFAASLLVACGSQPISTAEAERTAQQDLTTAYTPIGTPVIPIVLDSAACVGTGAASVNVQESSGLSYVVVYSCFPYHCNPTSKTCAATCASNADCAAGFLCQSGGCTQAPLATCLDGTTSHNNFTKVEENCGPYACGPVTGTCKDTCGTTDDCAPGFVCDIPNRICVNPY
jgi:hypothetical protein